MDILVIDIGGTSVKLWHTAHEEHRKFDSGDQLTPELMSQQTQALAGDWTYDAIALGLPCRISQGRPVDEPANLGPGWVGFNFAAALDRPVRIMNDACLQALGSYDNGRMLFLGLGTGLGSALVADRLVLQLGVGLGRIFGDVPLWEQLCENGLESLSGKARRKFIARAAGDLKAMFMADYVVFGGGGTSLLDDLPDGCRKGHNRTVVEGGRRLYDELPDPAVKTSDSWLIY